MLGLPQAAPEGGRREQPPAVGLGAPGPRLLAGLPVLAWVALQPGDHRHLRRRRLVDGHRGRLLHRGRLVRASLALAEGAPRCGLGVRRPAGLAALRVAAACQGAPAHGVPALAGRRGRRGSAVQPTPAAASVLHGQHRQRLHRRRQCASAPAAAARSLRAAPPGAAAAEARALPSGPAAAERAAGPRAPDRGAGRGCRGGEGQEGRGLGEELRGKAEHDRALVSEPAGQAQGRRVFLLLAVLPAGELSADAQGGFSPVAPGDELVDQQRGPGVDLDGARLRLHPHRQGAAQGLRGAPPRDTGADGGSRRGERGAPLRQRRAPQTDVRSAGQARRGAVPPGLCHHAGCHAEDAPDAGCSEEALAASARRALGEQLCRG
mmetsp:Transcript_40331/g.81348  ORF Transcript_40331/g.81348 Transcript_40331/m.81348 type:complete len:378 (+) Transcript_40331:627-1760(+)